MKKKINITILRKALANQRKDTLEQIKIKTESAKPVELDQSRVGRLTRMDAIQQQELARAGLERMQNELRAIDAALKRIETDVYGNCVKCGEQIECELLEVNPSLVICRSCRSID
tara:strand:- start:72 stop:416 length:345 start_codon:yes stop_codon:yes gene_type:complete